MRSKKSKSWQRIEATYLVRAAEVNKSDRGGRYILRLLDRPAAGGVDVVAETQCRGRGTAIDTVEAWLIDKFKHLPGLSKPVCADERQELAEDAVSVRWQAYRGGAF